MIKEALPEGWKIVKLGELLERITNGSSVRQYEEKTGYPIARIETIWNQTIDLNRVKYVKENDEDFVIKYAFQPDDILFSHINSDIHLGKTAIFKNQKLTLIHGINILLLRPGSRILSDYLNYQFKFLRREGAFIRIAQKSVNQSSINQAKLKQLEIILPPLPEQHLIVEKIEELFSELDKSIENLKTAQQQLKVYRQAVLKWAFEGKLTNEDVKDGELPVGWEWVKSGKLFSFVTSGSRGWAKYYSNDGAIFIRITNLEFDSLDLDLRIEKLQYVQPPLTSEGIRTKVQEGDFLFSITGYLGMFAIAPYLENAYVNQHVCLCRPKDNFNKKFVGYWIISKSGGNHYLNLNPKGAVKAGLNLDDLKNFPVPICTIAEQQQIVQEIESRLSVCDKMEDIINTNLQQAEALRQSILKKAFEGKLVEAIIS